MRTWTSSRGARIGVLLLPTVIVLVCVGITFSIAVAVQERSIRDTTAERVSDVASSLAQLAQVREALQADSGADAGADAEGASAGAVDPGASASSAAPRASAEAVAPGAPASSAEPDAGPSSLQPLADLVERAAGVDYVVISDASGVRLTHPTPSKRGERVSTDHSAVLAGEEFLGTEAGTLGPTLRAKVPVLPSGEVVVSDVGDPGDPGDEGNEGNEGNPAIGTVSVGILESRIAAELHEGLTELLPWTIGALLVGTVASTLLSAGFARRLRRLETLEVELLQQRRTATALREQTHEFHTRMHVIHGLVSHGDTTEALDYIDGVAPLHTDREVTGVDTHPLLRAVVDALTAELRAAGAALAVDVDVETPIDDELLLVIANLCRNAGESGATRVHLTLAESDGAIRGEVEDDGPGIPPQLGERIFSRGVTSKRDSTGAGRGVGLDLVRRILTSRNGTIEVGRSPLGGARFRFECAAAVMA